MLRAIAIGFLIIFFLFFFGLGDLVDKGVEYTKEQAQYTQKHGVQGLFERLWCGEARCKK